MDTDPLLWDRRLASRARCTASIIARLLCEVCASDTLAARPAAGAFVTKRSLRVPAGHHLAGPDHRDA